MNEQNNEIECGIKVPEINPKVKNSISIDSLTMIIFKIFTNTENSFKMFCCVILTFITIPIDMITLGLVFGLIIGCLGLLFVLIFVALGLAIVGIVILLGLAIVGFVIGLVLFPFYAIWKYYKEKQWPSFTDMILLC